MLLEARGLVKTFGSLRAVSDVSLALSPGEVKSIIGPNGAGKTTLFNLLTGELHPAAGTLYFRGEDITLLPPHRRAQRGIARSFQITNFFPNLSVWENVRIAAQAKHPERSRLLTRSAKLEAAAAEAEAVLRNLDLYDRRHLRARELSYGDQRHLEIAIALATGPELLLLDEPTSGMSPRETAQTILLIKRIARDLTILLIEHDMDVVMSVSDSVLVMSHGQKIAEGSPAEVAANREVQEVYLGGVA